MSLLPAASFQEPSTWAPHRQHPIQVGRAPPAHWRGGRSAATWHLGAREQAGGLGCVLSRFPAGRSRAQALAGEPEDRPSHAPTQLFMHSRPSACCLLRAFARGPLALCLSAPLSAKEGGSFPTSLRCLLTSTSVSLCSLVREQERPHQGIDV